MRAILKIARNANFVLGDLDVRILGDDFVHDHFAVAADFAGAIGEGENGTFAAHVLYHELNHRNRHWTA